MSDSHDIHLTRRSLVIRAGGAAAALALGATPARAARRAFPGADSFDAEVPTAWFELARDLLRGTPGYSPPVASRALGYAGLTLYEAVVPGISECEIVEMLARPRPGSPDAVPLLGFVDEGLLVSTGFDRHGVLLAPLAAAVAADLIEGRPIEEDLRSAIDPRRFAVSAAARPREDAAWTPPAVADLVGARPKGSR